MPKPKKTQDPIFDPENAAILNLARALILARDRKIQRHGKDIRIEGGKAQEVKPRLGKIFHRALLLNTQAHGHADPDTRVGDLLATMSDAEILNAILSYANI